MFLQSGLPTLVCVSGRFYQFRRPVGPALAKDVPMYGVLRGFDALEIITIVSATAVVVVGFIYLF